MPGCVGSSFGDIEGDGSSFGDTEGDGSNMIKIQLQSHERYNTRIGQSQEYCLKTGRVRGVLLGPLRAVAWRWMPHRVGDVHARMHSYPSTGGYRHMCVCVTLVGVQLCIARCGARCYSKNNCVCVHLHLPPELW